MTPWAASRVPDDVYTNTSTCSCTHILCHFVIYLGHFSVGKDGRLNEAVQLLSSSLHSFVRVDVGSGFVFGEMQRIHDLLEELQFEKPRDYPRLQAYFPGEGVGLMGRAQQRQERFTI